MSTEPPSSAKPSLWRDPTFRKVWLAETAPIAGMALSTLAIPLVAVLTLHANAFTVGVLGALAYAPFLVLSLPLGELIDRRARRPVLIAADLMRLCAWVSIPVASLIHGLSLAQLIVAQGVIGIASVISDIAGQAILPSILPQDELVDGSAKLAIGETASELVGPLICGALVGAISAPAVLAGSAISAATSATLLSRLNIKEEIDFADQSELTRSASLGLRLLFGDPVLRRFAVWAAIYNGSQGIVTAVVVLFMVHDLHLGTPIIGLLFSIGAAAALVGAFSVNWLSSRLGVGRAIAVFGAVAALAYIALPLAPARGAPAAAFVAITLLLDDGASAVAVVLISSVRVALINPAQMGRVMAGQRLVAMGAIPVGALLGGVLGDVVGYRETLGVAAAVMVLSIPVIVSSHIFGMRQLPGRRVGLRLDSDTNPVQA